MKAILFIITLFFLYTGCKQQEKVNNARAILFYEHVSRVISKTKPAIQKFINAIATARSKLNNDPKAIIDTGKLQLLLETAQVMNRTSQSAIQKITEVDNTIDYKQKTLKTGVVLGHLLNVEFPACIKIFGGGGDNRRFLIDKLMLPKLKELKAAQNEIIAADEKFKTKYHISTTNDSIDTAPALPIITQSAKQIKLGNDLIITIQVEPLNDTLNPRVQIDGIDVPINPNGLVIYSKTVSGAYGDHSILITVIHPARDGKSRKNNYIVEYTIEK